MKQENMVSLDADALDQLAGGTELQDLMVGDKTIETCDVSY